jgi:hypothetical protein
VFFGISAELGELADGVLGGVYEREGMVEGFGGPFG